MKYEIIQFCFVENNHMVKEKAVKNLFENGFIQRKISIMPSQYNCSSWKTLLHNIELKICLFILSLHFRQRFLSNYSSHMVETLTHLMFRHYIW